MRSRKMELNETDIIAILMMRGFYDEIWTYKKVADLFNRVELLTVFTELVQSKILEVNGLLVLQMMIKPWKCYNLSLKFSIRQLVENLNKVIYPNHQPLMKFKDI